MTVLTTSDTTHIFTVDVEEHFHVSAFERHIGRADWDVHESRVERNVDILLGLLERHKSSGTFFVLGWLAQRHPELVRRIADAGHEIASHGYNHQRVTQHSPASFREDVRSAKQLLEDITGHAIAGFRAPSFSIVPGLEWALDILLEEGHVYDSSLFPVRRRGYGYPSAPPLPHRVPRNCGTLLELPPMTLQWRKLRIPAGGGAYFRHFPYAITQHALREHGREHVPGVFYIHPWEVDPGQPVLVRSPVTRLRHYGGLHNTARRLERLLSEFRFTSAASRLGLATSSATGQGGLPVASV